MINIHATCISLKKKGILLLGKSGSGKSDLAFRAIMQKGARLVADDRVDLEAKKGVLTASCPKNIQGLLEIRGIGIRRYPYIKKQTINLAIELVDNIKNIERMPEEEYEIFEGVKVKKIKLYPFELSSLDKLISSLQK